MKYKKYGMDKLNIKFCICVVIIVIMIVYSPFINYGIVSTIDYSKLTSLFASIGCTYISVTVIAFSFMTFVTQINVERMPYGLFYYFSKDKKLLRYFVAIFFLAITFTSLNLVNYPEAAGYLVLVALIISFFIVFFLIKSYLRIFQLINPTEQLTFLLRKILLDMSIWGKKADKYVKRKIETNNGVDEKKLKFLNDNPEWLASSYEALRFCNVYIRRYFIIGEKDICSHALGLIIVMNQEYVEIKGNTFYSPVNFINDGRENDPFITETLEQMKRDIQFSIANNDEEFSKIIMRGTSKLVEVYLKITYPSENNDKYHAYLASSYCQTFIENFLNHNMRGALEEGIDLIGSNAELLIPYNNSSHLSIRALRKISLISLQANNEYSTEKCVRQLARLTLITIKMGLKNNKGVLVLLQKSLFEISKDYITPSFHIFSNHLEPYFSVTDPAQFLGTLEGIIHQLISEDSDDERHGIIQNNIFLWLSNVYQFDIYLVTKSLELKSDFLFIIFNWLCTAIKIEIAVQSKLKPDTQITSKISSVLSQLINICEIDFGFNCIIRFSFDSELIEIGQKFYQARQNNLFSVVFEGLIKWSIFSFMNNNENVFSRSFLGALRLAINKNDKNIAFEYLERQLEKQEINKKDFSIRLRDFMDGMQGTSRGNWIDDKLIDSEIKPAALDYLDNIIKKLES